MSEVRRITSGGNEEYSYEEWLTDDDKLRVLKVTFADGIKTQGTYNPWTEEFRKALDRVKESGKKL